MERFHNSVRRSFLEMRKSISLKGIERAVHNACYIRGLMTTSVKRIPRSVSEVTHSLISLRSYENVFKFVFLFPQIRPQDVTTVLYACDEIFFHGSFLSFILFYT